MELREYVAILRKRWIAVVATFTIVFATVGAATFAMTPTYEATTRLFFAVPVGESVADLAQGSSFTEKQMGSYAQVATSPLVLQGVAEELASGLDASELAGTVRASVPPNTVILEITASSTESDVAASVANAVGSRLSSVVSSLYPERLDGSESVRATTLSSAEAPSEPSSPNLGRNLAIGLVLGLLVGVGVAFLREGIDTKIRSAQDVNAVAEGPVLGSVAFDSDAARHPIFMIDRPAGNRAEAIRRVRTNLQFVDAAASTRSILVTSSVASEGKTTTTINLAIALTDAGQRVLVIDADLRRPSVQDVLGIENGAGLTSVLIGQARPEDVIQPWQGRIDVLASGPIPPNPSELLGSPSMSLLLAHLAESYDTILLDSPPILPVTDAAVVSTLVDGTLLVVGADQISRAQLESALSALDSVGSHVVGIVLNKVDMQKRDAYDSTYAYSHQEKKGSALSPDFLPETPEREFDASSGGRGGPAQRHRAS